jgi:hypothetical protein
MRRRAARMRGPVSAEYGGASGALLDSNTDCRIYPPTNGPLVGGITIAGDCRMGIIGGEVDLPYPCSNDASDRTGIYIAKSSPGAVLVEGVSIHDPHRIGRTCPGGASRTLQTCSTGHGIDINTADNGGDQRQHDHAEGHSY